ncbi:MAG: IS256 family transposase [Alphaproteobacteria bacterium]|nr:IS256 family transposase [Alphaproteobacteria bacterium]
MSEKQQTTIDDLVASLAGEVDSPDDLSAAVAKLKKLALERMLQAEMTEHLGYEKHAKEGFDGGNSRNGSSPKTVLMDTGAIELDVPRDRAGSFDPQVVKKGQRRLQGFDDKLISLYARGLSVREIQAHLQEIYGIEVSPALISKVTDQVLDAVREWQKRTLDRVYPIVYLDGFVVKVRKEGVVRNRTIYVALGVNMRGRKEVLGLWVADTEGAKFWLHVINDLKNRGVEDILIASVDGLKGFPEAIEATFPRAIVQTCIVHMVRHSTNLVSWKNKREMASDLKAIYRAGTEDEAVQALATFREKWDAQYPTIGRSWETNWQRVRPFFEFGPEIRRAIYTTNAIEALNRQLRKITKTRGAFPSDDAVFKLLWLAIDRASQKWTYTKQAWDQTIQQLSIHFGDRLPLEDYANHR